MFERKLPDDLMSKLCAALEVKIGPPTLTEFNSLLLLTNYNSKHPGFAHKLSVVQVGEQFCGVDFDVERGCWYNPDNRYGMQNTYFNAVLDALAVRLNILPSAREQARQEHGALLS